MMAKCLPNFSFWDGRSDVSTSPGGGGDEAVLDLLGRGASKSAATVMVPGEEAILRVVESRVSSSGKDQETRLATLGFLRDLVCERHELRGCRFVLPESLVHGLDCAASARA